MAIQSFNGPTIVLARLDHETQRVHIGVWREKLNKGARTLLLSFLMLQGVEQLNLYIGVTPALAM